MKAASWLLRVTDAGGKRHRGRVSVTPDPPTKEPQAPDTFHIVLLSAARSVADPPAATAICSPSLAKRAADAGSPQRDAATRLRRDSALPRTLAEQYRAGAIVTPAGAIDAAKVFLRDGRVRLEPLALMLVEQAAAEAIAPYLAVIRHELRLASGTDARLALRLRLHPGAASERPSRGAPAIGRLARTLRALENGQQPGVSLEQLTEDLRILGLFAPGPSGISAQALERLLRDVTGPPAAAAPSNHAPAPIVRLRPRGGRG